MWVVDGSDRERAVSRQLPQSRVFSFRIHPDRRHEGCRPRSGERILVPDHPLSMEWMA